MTDLLEKIDAIVAAVDNGSFGRADLKVAIIDLVGDMARSLDSNRRVLRNHLSAHEARCAELVRERGEAAGRERAALIRRLRLGRFRREVVDLHTTLHALHAELDAIEHETAATPGATDAATSGSTKHD